jgi:hypothetical protein
MAPADSVLGSYHASVWKKVILLVILSGTQVVLAVFATALGQ